MFAIRGTILAACCILWGSSLALGAFRFLSFAFGEGLLSYALATGIAWWSFAHMCQSPSLREGVNTT